MKLRRNKKGFTIVELVIVIAVIGVLAAILIPTFINLTNKANKASDESLVKNLNTALAMQEQEVGDTKNNTLHDAVEDLKEYGYLLPNLVTKSEDKLLWNQETNRFILDKDITDSDTKVNFWRIQDSIKGDEEYSIYAGRDFEGNGPTVDTVNVKVGFDVGYHDEITTVNYANTVADQKVRIRTAGGTLNIGTSATVAKGTIHQYGPIDKAEVYTEKNSFHSHGVVQYLDLKAGKAVADEDGIIYVMKASSGTEIAEENGGVIIIPSDATSADIQTNDLPDGYVVTETGTTQPTDIAEKIAKNQGLLGSGTLADPFQVYNKQTMQAISLMYTTKYNYFSVNIAKTANGKIDCENWTPVRLLGSFNGKGVEFINLHTHLFAAAVGVVTDGSNYSGNAGFYSGSAESFNNSQPITIEGFTVNAEIKGASDACGVVRSVGTNITFRNINVKGYIEGYVASGISSYGAYQFGDDTSRNPNYKQFKSDLTFTNCNITATLVALNEGAAGLIQHPYSNANSTWTITDCAIESEMYSTKSGINLRNFKYNYQGSTNIYDNGEKVASQTRYEGSKSHELTYNNPALVAPASKGQVFTIAASGNANYAIFGLIISPNPGSMTATYLSERVELADNSFKSNAIKYCDVKVNTTAGTAGYNNDSTVFNVYSTAFDGTSNGQFVQVVQYAADGSIISISRCNLACL